MSFRARRSEILLTTEETLQTPENSSISAPPKSDWPLDMMALWHFSRAANAFPHKLPFQLCSANSWQWLLERTKRSRSHSATVFNEQRSKN